ncbi:unnamed protein product [Rhizophagus irregularis]|nr:unnamed protein product [Rhizophagus irregularis]
MTSVKKWIEEKIKNEYIRYFEYDEFSPINEIGRGSFGKVIKANLANTGLVALKIIISKNSDEHDEVNDEFIKELKLLREVDYHPKINRCLGITKDSENYILECWDGKPESRPDIEKVHEILSQLLINTEASSQPNTIRNSYDNDDLTISSNYPSLNLINNQNLSTVLDKEFAEKENTSQAQIPCLQNEKQVLTDNLTEQLELELKQNFIKEETFQGQSALITNYRMDDDDKNRSVQLKRDIEELQNKLKCYVTTLKGDFEIDFKEVINLMGKYNIKTKITPKQPNKPLIKGVLQHHIIKTITKDIRKYFKGNLNEHSIIHLEKEIATTAKDLENKLNDFSKTRNGDDTITQSASIKVRQDVNIALGNRGFSDVLSNGNYTSHVYIIMKTTELNREMNKYRIIKDVIKRNYIEKLAPYLIREFTRIFQFRLKVQEPRAQMRWIKTESSIDPSIMEGNWDKDDIDNLEVEICSFPMIGRDLDDVDKRKIYTHAQIFTRRKKLFTKGIDYLSNLTSKKAKVYLELESDDDSYNGED